MMLHTLRLSHNFMVELIFITDFQYSFWFTTIFASTGCYLNITIFQLAAVIWYFSKMFKRGEGEGKNQK